MTHVSLIVEDGVSNMFAASGAEASPRLPSSNGFKNKEI